MPNGTGSRIHSVKIGVSEMDEIEILELFDEFVKIHADIEVSDINVSKNEINFKAASSNMNDPTVDDIRMKLDEYMHEQFKIKSIEIRALLD